MKKKQVLGVFVVCLILIVTGIIGMSSSLYMERVRQESKDQAVKKIESFVGENNENITLPTGDFIGQLDIVGTIQSEGTVTDSVSTGKTYKHDFYLQFIEKMENAENNKGILLYVNSPGGTVYESDEMYLKLMEYKEKTGRPVYAYFANEACSGAYYISMAADKIYANRNCWTGSIGVIISLMNYEGLMKKLGVSEIDITSGENKTIGSAAHPMTPKQEKILQSLVDEAYEQFTGIVADGRDMKIDRVKKLADGRIYSAAQAEKYGLIDEIMLLDEAKDVITSSLGEGEVTFYAPKQSTLFQNYFFQFVSKYKIFGQQSDIQAAKEMIENDESGVLMYYAK
jgi:protease-4